MSLRHQPQHKRHAISLQGSALRDDAELSAVILNHRGELLFADPAPAASRTPMAPPPAPAPPAPAPVAGELSRLDAKIAAVQHEMRLFAAEVARADDDIVALQLDPRLPGSIAGRSEERRVAARAHKQLAALLLQLQAKRDRRVAGLLASDPGFAALVARIESAQALLQKLDDTEDAAFRALAKIAPNVVVADATHAGVTPDTAGPMNLPVRVFVEQVQLHVADLERALAAHGFSARLMSPSDDADELVFLRSLVKGIRARLAQELRALEQDHRAALEAVAHRAA